MEALPPLIVAHYTAGRSAENTIRRFRDPASKVSAHFVIAESGDVTQMVGCERKAWHAGPSRISLPSGEVLRSVNNHSIGIELDYDGPLRSLLEGRRRRTAAEALHERTQLYWPMFDQRQIDAFVALVNALVEREWTAPETFIVGHEDVSPGRKRDPGPAFPWADVLARTGLRRLRPALDTDDTKP